MPIVPGVLVPLDEERLAARDDEPSRGVAREIVVEREGFACVFVANGRFGMSAVRPCPCVSNAMTWRFCASTGINEANDPPRPVKAPCNSTTGRPSP